jgi:hypothetical protein
MMKKDSFRHADFLETPGHGCGGDGSDDDRKPDHRLGHRHGGFGHPRGGFGCSERFEICKWFHYGLRRRLHNRITLVTAVNVLSGASSVSHITVTESFDIELADLRAERGDVRVASGGNILVAGNVSALGKVELQGRSSPAAT